MTDTIQTFFDAWGDTDADQRQTKIAAAMADPFTYADPRSDGAITSLDALTAYVGQFTDTAPCWTATVVQSDTHSGFSRALVAFLENGEARQHGTYFARHDATGQLTQLVGFVGAGGLPA